MDALISLVYTIIDSVCVCLFLDAFASHRWRDHRFLVGVIVQTILMYASIEFSVIALNRNQIVKIFLVLLSCFIVARTLYENISGKFLLFLIVIEYLLIYSLSFAVGMLATSVCGMDAQTFQADKALSLIYGISYYSAELFIIALFRKMMLQRMGNRPRSDAQHSQLILYFLFPSRSPQYKPMPPLHPLSSPGSPPGLFHALFFGSVGSSCWPQKLANTRVSKQKNILAFTCRQFQHFGNFMYLSNCKLQTI